MKKILIALAALATISAQAQKFEGLALTPPMGWNSWNTFQTNISEALVKETADKMVSSGMRDAGYVYLVLDDGWMAKKRDSLTGDLVADPAKFPNGMKVVADYVHAKGLKFGLYNCAGTLTCAGYPGTRGYEYQDARYYAKQEIDYLKFDWCSSNGINAKEAYGTMSKALKTAGRPIVFSLCEWGQNKPWQWASNVGHLWRSTGDITAQFTGKKVMGDWSALGVTTILDQQDSLRKYAGPGHWNDPDMLEVGNGLSMNENRAHFTLWSLLAAPLIAGNDIRKMSAETAAILTNKDVTAINQDKLGIQAYRAVTKDSIETWIKPLSNGEVAICFFNRSEKPVAFSYNWQANPIVDTLSKTNINFTTTSYNLMDIWQNKMLGNTSKMWSGTIPGHDVVLVKMTAAGKGKK